LKNTVLRSIFIEKKDKSHPPKNICTFTEYKGKESKKGRRKKEKKKILTCGDRDGIYKTKYK
jgi:hypothetical protein